jgi:cytochrome c biogenesis protein CcmG, thiol:disulfide interchange protein DsbE
MIEQRIMKISILAFFAACLGIVIPTAPANVSIETQELLNQIRSAYSSIQTLSITGTIHGQFDIDNEVSNQDAQFTAIYDHGKFRNEVTGDSLVGNTGKGLYLYLPSDNRYLLRDLPLGSDRLDAMDDDIANLIRRQNPSLALALSGDAAAELTSGATSVERVPSFLIANGKPAPTLKIVRPDRNTYVAFDPATNLLLLQKDDLTALALKRGAGIVKEAVITTTMVETPGAAIDPARFGFAPPPGAQALQSNPSEGSSAPSFSLTALDGSQVSSGQLKGSVYVLDFWATWCPPCIASLPKLDDLYQSIKDPDLKIFAVNEGEDKDKVQKFIDSKKLTLPILLDSDASVGSAFGASAIPYLVIVGRDGKIAKIEIGLMDEDAVRKDIQTALGQK